MDMIQAIVNIEEKVRHITDSTNALKREYEENLQKEIQIRQQETEAKISSCLKQHELRVQAEQAEELEYLEQEYEKKLEKLLHTFQENKQDWVREIVHRVTHPCV